MDIRRPGKLITLEGTEGSGKSVQAGLLVNYLKTLGYKTVLTHEPGGTYTGKKLRSILLDPRNKSICPATELFLYLADRAQHLEEVIIPLMEKRHIVVCDRFIDATAAYQGYGREIDPELVQALNEVSYNGTSPFLTILLDLPVEIGLKRAISSGSRGGDRIEREKIQFHKRVKRGYIHLAKESPQRIKIVKAAGSILGVHKRIRRIVIKRLNAAQKGGTLYAG